MNRLTILLQTTCKQTRVCLKPNSLRPQQLQLQLQARSRFHTTRKQHSPEPQPPQPQSANQPPPTQPAPAQSAGTTKQQQQQQLSTDTKHLTPDEILFHDPLRVRTDVDNAPGLHALGQMHPEQFTQNAKFLASGSIYSNKIPSAHLMGAQQPAGLTYEMTRGMPNLARLHQGAGGTAGGPGPVVVPKSRSILPNLRHVELSPEQKTAKHRKNFKKAAALSLCIGVVIVTLQNFYKKKGAMQDSEAAAAQAEIDYTTKTISNENHSVSLLAEEIIDDMIRSLVTVEDHQHYMETQLTLPPVFQTKNALTLPLFVARNPTRLQTKYNQTRHDIEMKAIYTTPPLNNLNVEFYLNDLEKMNRDYRRAHDETIVMRGADAHTTARLGDRIGFELQLRPKRD